MTVRQEVKPYLVQHMEESVCQEPHLGLEKVGTKLSWQSRRTTTPSAEILQGGRTLMTKIELLQLLSPVEKAGSNSPLSCFCLASGILVGVAGNLFLRIIYFKLTIKQAWSWNSHYLCDNLQTPERKVFA